MSSKKLYNSILNKIKKASNKEKTDVFEIKKMPNELLSIYFGGKDFAIELSRKEFQQLLEVGYFTLIKSKNENESKNFYKLNKNLLFKKYLENNLIEPVYIISFFGGLICFAISFIYWYSNENINGRSYNVGKGVPDPSKITNVSLNWFEVLVIGVCLTLPYLINLSIKLIKKSNS